MRFPSSTKAKSEKHALKPQTKKSDLSKTTFIALAVFALATPVSHAQELHQSAILTPTPGPIPRINGAKTFGVRPGHPVLWTIPATGTRPLSFSAQGLPPGITLDSQTGRLSGSSTKAGDYQIVFEARNQLGSDTQNFKLSVGETVALTPPMGWNHYNLFGIRTNQEQVIRQAKALVESGLINHGWSYINLDDGWQGARGGPFNAIQPDPKRFQNLRALCDEVHRMGLKIGIYSTPWVESYGNHIGGSSMNASGLVDNEARPMSPNFDRLPFTIGKYHFWRNDALQFADWGFDYLKYDWNPIKVAETKAMNQALRLSGRDVVFSLSNGASFAGASDWAQWSNAWRTGRDIKDSWSSVKQRILNQDKWAPYAGPGHWNDLDMMIVGVIGRNKRKKRPTPLTPDQQYTHMSAWALMSSPLILGCDLTKLDAFTLNLLTNDEIIAINQDALGKQATIVHRNKDLVVMSKPLEDGSRAVGFFNVGDKPNQIVKVRWEDLGIKGSWIVRDAWRQRDLGTFQQEFQSSVNAHGVMMLNLRPAS